MEIDKFEEMRAQLREHLADPRTSKVHAAFQREKLRQSAGKQRKAGRPRKNGVRPPEYLFRVGAALFGFDEARRCGEKYEAALEAGVRTAQESFPDLPMSKTALKRFLGEFRSSISNETFLFEKTADSLVELKGPVWNIRIGATPTYMRNNAREPTPARKRGALAEIVFKNRSKKSQA